MENEELGIETLAARAGLGVRVGDTVATVGPIAASTTFSYDSVEQVHAALAPDGDGFAYGRNANPTVVSLERAVAAIAGAEDCVAFGSGMAAISAAVGAVSLGDGDLIIAARDLYGVSRSFFNHLAEGGVETEYVDILDSDGMERALTPARARVLYFESIANPLLQTPEIARLAAIARRHHAIVVLDNTFATPYLFRGSENGVDLEVHSATKYLAGHGDVTAGVVVANTSWCARMRSLRTVTGGILSPFEAWLTLRGLRTLPIRIERQCDHAFELAKWMQNQSWIDTVYYPGLAPDSVRTRIAAQFGGRFGAMVAFDLHAEEEGVLRFMNELELITAGTSLGDVGSLVLYPRLSSHRGLGPEGLAAARIGAGLLRLSVGLENVLDLTRDLTRAAVRAGIAQEVLPIA